MGQPLYRFTSFQSFVDVVQSKQLTFVKPESWDDTYEGYVYKLIYKRRNFNKLYEEIKKIAPDFDTDLKKLREESKRIYAQCWTKNIESDALWRINAHGKMAVRIEIDAKDVPKLSEFSRNVTLEEVDYEENLNLVKELKKIIFPTQRSSITISTPTKGIVTKRKAFKHEEEIRLIHMRPPVGHIESVDSIKALNKRKKKIEELFANNQINESTYNYLKTNPTAGKVIKIPFDHIPNFIKSVMLHPQAPEWFNHTLRKYCEINDLNYLGKSKLYEKP